jgi:hypothetical protein
MDLTSRDGTRWAVYVEAVPSNRRRARISGVDLLPDRRLRFDSNSESRVLSEVPAGSPFLPEARLQELLAFAAPLAGAGSPAEVSLPPEADRGSSQSPARALQLGAAVAATAAVTEGARRWRQARERQRSIRSRLDRGLAAAAERVTLWVGALLQATRRARF